MREDKGLGLTPTASAARMNLAAIDRRITRGRGFFGAADRPVRMSKQHLRDLTDRVIAYEGIAGSVLQSLAAAGSTSNGGSQIHRRPWRKEPLLGAPTDGSQSTVRLT